MQRRRSLRPSRSLTPMCHYHCSQRSCWKLFLFHHLFLVRQLAGLHCSSETKTKNTSFNKHCSSYSAGLNSNVFTHKKQTKTKTQRQTFKHCIWGRERCDGTCWWGSQSGSSGPCDPALGPPPASPGQCLAAPVEVWSGWRACAYRTVRHKVWSRRLLYLFVCFCFFNCPKLVSLHLSKLEPMCATVEETSQLGESSGSQKRERNRDRRNQSSVLQLWMARACVQKS